jgi:hypothetical protein
VASRGYYGRRGGGYEIDVVVLAVFGTALALGRQLAGRAELRELISVATLEDTIMARFDLTSPSSAQREAITARLTREQRDVLLEHGTEAAFCGVFLDNHKDGVYRCRFCGLPLFRSSAKFDSGTGWPSFFEPYNEAHIRRVRTLATE